MAILHEGGEILLQAHLELGALAAALDEGGVGGHPVDPGADRGASLEAVDLAGESQEHVLHHLLRVGVGAGDTACDPEDPRGVALHELLEGGVVAIFQALDEHCLRDVIHASAPPPGRLRAGPRGKIRVPWPAILPVRGPAFVTRM